MSNTTRGLLCLLACATGALAEDRPFTFGVRGGAPFSVQDTLLDRVGGGDRVSRFIIGPTAGVRLPFGFSVEGDALYTRNNVRLIQLVGLNASVGGGSWQFPIMARYTGPWRVAPVVGAGVSVRHTNQFADIPSFLLGGGGGTSVGFVTGLGLRIKAGPVNITPELRYTYWGAGSLSQSLLNLIPFTQHEAAALVAITF
jgi:hypothetical protein